MITGILYGERPRELMAIGLLLRENVLCQSGDGCSFSLCSNHDELVYASKLRPNCDIVCVDVGSGAVSMAYEVRAHWDAAKLLLVADADVPATSLIRPGMFPSVLLQRPIHGKVPGDAAEAFVRDVLATRWEQPLQECFVVQDRQDVLRLPFAHLFIFEARAKRIYVRTDAREYSYYDTLESLQRRLPASFVRCHRSFIINIAHVWRLHLGRNLVVMDDGSHVPVSRSYKAQLKELLT